MGLDEFMSNGNEGSYYEDEKSVVDELEDQLSEDGFDVEKQETGVDIIARSDDYNLVIEMKRHYADPGQQVYTALGQIIYRMHEEDIAEDSLHAAIGFPRDVDGVDVYREHVEENISQGILEMLSIYTVLVDTEGYEIIEPGEIGSK